MRTDVNYAGLVCFAEGAGCPRMVRACPPSLIALGGGQSHPGDNHEWAPRMPTKTSLHLWDDRFLYVTPDIQTGLTARSSATLLVSASGKPFTLVTRDGQRLLCHAAWVPPHVARRLDVDGGGLLSLNLDPASVAYRALSAALGTHVIQPIPADCFHALRDVSEGALHGELSDVALRQLANGMVQAVCGMPAPGVRMDRRIETVLVRLRAAQGRVLLTDLAATASLSPDRLTHLFREQTGLSIKRYLVWAKIRRSVQQMSQGRPLTDIAHECGFSDSAHMSHTYQQHFGLPPSFLADAKRVAVTVDKHASNVWSEAALA